MIRLGNLVIIRISPVWFLSFSLYFCTMKYIYFAVGSLSLLLGIIGIFLPVLPTTPFLLLSAALYVRSLQRAYHWLISHKYLGPYIRCFREDKSIPLHAKVVSISLMWITALFCVFFKFSHIVLDALMLVVAVSVTAYILSFKTRKSA